ncbi:hypothetical protein BIZ36_03975 [Cytophaga sp. FL35]|nr:hypothetical protein [Cytophaga sp. FL35]
MLLSVQLGTAQNKYEREYRIKKSQFPEKALELISTKLEDARRVRFYKETDSIKVSYEAKFKKDHLHYSVEFDEDGVLEDVEILIKSIDIPDDSYSLMTKYLEKKFIRYRIRRMQQQYPVGADPIETTLRNAFQNLMLPTIKYELIVSGKGDSGYQQFEILFNANGDFEKIRKSLPPNYDHVLY